MELVEFTARFFLLRLLGDIINTNQRKYCTFLRSVRFAQLSGCFIESSFYSFGGFQMKPFKRVINRLGLTKLFLQPLNLF